MSIRVENDIPKRALDLVASLLLLAALAPLLLLLALLVKLSSPGPVLFRQQRVGRGGRLFRLYKFRSMRAAQGGEGGRKGSSLTASGDSRVTPLGKRLRAWKLDELPQLYNVLTGEMSLVGPRPEVPEYVRCYSEEQLQVLSVRPGLTGAGQLEFRDEEALLAGRPDVEAFYLGTVMPAKLALDLRYVRERTLEMDVQILFRTAAAVLRKPRTPPSGSPGTGLNKC